VKLLASELMQPIVARPARVAVRRPIEFQFDDSIAPLLGLVRNGLLSLEYAGVGYNPGRKNLCFEPAECKRRITFRAGCLSNRLSEVRAWCILLTIVGR
jgi:hypothetical protein